MRVVWILLGVLWLLPRVGMVAVWPTGVDPVLSEGDAARYKKLFAQAHAGREPQGDLLRALDDEGLVPHVKAEYWAASGRYADYGTLRAWLEVHGDLPQAVAVYRAAVNKRPAAPQSCKTTMVKKKVGVKGKGKKAKERLVTKRVPERVCKTVGPRPEAPRLPAALQEREDRKARAERLRELEYAGMSAARAAARREILGHVWRARQQGNLVEALAALDSVRAREVVGHERWQDEVVRLADMYFGKEKWADARRVASVAARVQGPQRDAALWIAGKSAYRLGDKAGALRVWRELLAHEPKGGKHEGRVAYWGARVAEELGQAGVARELLGRAALSPLSFYGQLALAKMGGTPGLERTVPGLRDSEVDALLKVKGAKRALALAQVGETILAQEELRRADDNLPYGSARSLAALGLQLNMPAVALLAGRQLLERGQTLVAALYPEVPWRPTGGVWHVDRALVMGIMRQESAFYPRIGSQVGAQGLMQIMPATGRYIKAKLGVGDPYDLHHPGNSLAMGGAYLKYLQGETGGNLMMTIAAYNGGLGNVRKWLRNGRTPGHDPLLWLESIPFDETRDYVEKVMANLWIYEGLMGQRSWSREALADGYWPLERMARLGN